MQGLVSEFVRRDEQNAHPSTLSRFEACQDGHEETMSDVQTEQLRALLEEAKLRLRDLTRELDESMRAEDEELVLAELHKARDRVVALEHSLERLEADGDGSIKKD